MLTKTRLHELLYYSQETGLFTWIKSAGTRAVIGKEAGGADNSGYTRIMIDKVFYFAHRLAFLYVDGYLPENDVDHINGHKMDNRWENLRHVSRACNMQNSKVSNSNTSGFTGVSFNKTRGKWYARMYVNNKCLCLGSYDSPHEAALARITCEDWCPDWHCDERCESRKKVFAALSK